jgi:hypothetical protein
MKRILFTAVMVVLFPSLAAAQSVHVVVPAVRVTVAPPPLRVEVRPVAPSPAHVWIGGHWVWRGSRHVWIAGDWARPPRSGYVWVEPRWVPQAGQWVFYEGYWNNPVVVTPSTVYQPTPRPAQPIEARFAPPAPIVEVRPALPFHGAAWIAGHWHWTGAQYVWMAGSWSAPRRGYVWVPGHWQPAGPHWRFVPGRWRAARQ